MLKTALKPDPIHLGGALPASLGLHAAVLALLLAWEWISPETGPLIDPDEVMEVTMVALPKQTTALPQKEMRAPTSSAQKPEELSLSKEKKPADPKAESKTEPPKPDNSRARSDLLKQLRKEEALKNVAADAPEGPMDQSQTSPDGVEGAIGSGTSSMGDPELAAYVERLRQALMANFAPIQTEPLTVLVDIQIDESGAIKDHSVRTPSGNPSFDSAAVRAVLKTARLPTPPDKYKDVALSGITIRFSNQ